MEREDLEYFKGNLDQCLGFCGILIFCLYNKYSSPVSTTSPTEHKENFKRATNQTFIVDSIRALYIKRFISSIPILHIYLRADSSEKINLFFSSSVSFNNNNNEAPSTRAIFHLPPLRKRRWLRPISYFYCDSDMLSLRLGLIKHIIFHFLILLCLAVLLYIFSFVSGPPEIYLRRINVSDGDGVMFLWNYSMQSGVDVIQGGTFLVFYLHFFVMIQIEEFCGKITDVSNIN